MKVLITGTSNGIGHAAAYKFLNEGHRVIGLDLLPCDIKDCNYKHYICDVSDKNQLPDIKNINILINNAGLQNSADDIKNNLYSVINCTEKYGLQNNIKSIINQASVSAHNGCEFPNYVASKGGVLAYTKWTAKEIAKYGATCNSLSLGGVLTDLNDVVISDEAKWKEIMSMTPLNKWLTPDECAEWIYFLTIYNKSMSGQDLLIDNLETLNHKFVW